MSKFSVKKPFTVLVAVILVIVMGVVSFTKMTPDLFPNIDMPYVIVVTPYVGATPEKVEDNVTSPLEQNLATLTDIKNVQSVSNSNYSMIILEFENSVNMDTVSTDILQKINLVEGAWEDTVGTPTIMKINPNMIPIDVVAVDYEGKDRAELSAFLDDTLLNKLEGISGVASVDNSGLLDEKINIVISQDKIDKINNKILASVNEQLADAENQLYSKKNELKDTRKDLTDATTKLKDTNTQLEDTKTELEAASKELKETNKQLKEAKPQLEEALVQINDGLAAIEDGKAKLELAKPFMSEEDYNTQLAALTGQEKELKKSKKETETALKQTNDGIKQTDEGIKQTDEGLKQTKEGIKQTEDGLKQTKEGIKQIDDGMVQIDDAAAQLDAQADEARKQANIGDKITIEMVSNILMAQNFEMPAGYVDDKGNNVLVSVGDDISSVKQAQKLFLFDSGIDSVGKIYLEDVADVFMTDNNSDIYAKINGEDGIILSFSKQSNYATATVCDNIDAQFEKLSEQYEGLHFTTLMNQGEYIGMIVKSIMSSLLWGALFAVIVLFLFLRGFKPTFITICSIPISILFAIMLMYFSGISLNMISLSGLATSVGMLVDNSVVVIENTVRLRRLGVPAPKAAVAGAKQVGGAITASTITTICVFVPIIFTDGLTRELFTDMGLTLAYTLLASLIVAMTLVPAMSSRLLKNTRETESPFFTKVMEKYKGFLRGVLRYKIIVLLGALVLLVGSVYFSVDKGFIFMPEMSSPQMQASLEMPKESTLDETIEEADKAMKAIRSVDEVDTVGAMMSGTSFGMSQSGGTSVSFYIMLKDDISRSNAEIAKDINEKCKNVKGDFEAQGSSMGDFTTALGGSGISINVYSSDIHDLQNTSHDIAEILSKVEGVAETDDGIEESDKEYHFKVKKTTAMKKGLTVAQVYTAIVDAMKYENKATSITIGDNSYEVIVSSEQKEALTAKDIKNLTLEITGQDGEVQEIKLNDIATLEETETLKAIRHDNQRRYLTVSGTLDDGYNITKVTSEAEKAVAEYELPVGTSIEFGGENQTIMDAMEDMMLMLALGILFVYLVMVAQFQSLKSPFIIMFTIPLAFTGGFLSLLLFNKEISVIAMLGMIMLTGIIVNNGIVLVDYINQLRAAGMSKKDAIVEAGATRIRPILMTSLTTIMGLAVMAFGNEMGTDMMQPVALVCIGGLLYATILTLFVVPSIYDLMNGEKYKHLSEDDLDISDIIMS